MHLQLRTNPPHRILVVDDEPEIRLISSEVLIRYGYKVDAAEDGEMAWKALNSHRYNLLITDNNMPKVSGIELLKKLRAARMALPVIMATGTLARDEITRNACLQPAAILIKPYTQAELLATVSAVLRAMQDDREQGSPAPKLGLSGKPIRVGLYPIAAGRPAA